MAIFTGLYVGISQISCGQGVGDGESSARRTKYLKFDTSQPALAIHLKGVDPSLPDKEHLLALMTELTVAGRISQQQLPPQSHQATEVHYCVFVLGSEGYNSVMLAFRQFHLEGSKASLSVYSLRDCDGL